MNFARAEAIARAVLYEGYNLYPYRPSALKNRQRWTFGGVFPRGWAALHPDDRSTMRTECLVRGGADTLFDIRVRFLHILAREVGELAEPLSLMPADGEPAWRAVPSLDVDGIPYIGWDEAQEREVRLPVELPRLLAGPATLRFGFAAERSVEPVRDAAGNIALLLVRTAEALAGEVTVTATPVAAGAYRLSVQVDNGTLVPEPPALTRDRAQRLALASTHTLLGVEAGAFVSLLDPPAGLGEAAAGCGNAGTWPVLVGGDGGTEAELMLSSPIILYDDPKIAPESPGDLFDGCEIDEILILRILTLTPAEKREMAAADPRTRALLQRTEALRAEELAMLHGTFREIASGAPASTLAGKPRLAAEPAPHPFRVGDRVRLRPKPGGDAMDIVLKDQVAVVEAIERDFEDRVHIAVTMLDDPGRDLGLARMPGHRFFFAPDELEPISAGAAA